MIIDVSKHNGNIAWNQLKGVVEGAIIRCGYGNDDTTQDDIKFKANIEGAISNGIPVGVYIYSYASDSIQALSEANHLKRLVDPYKSKLSLPVYIDVEEHRYSSSAVEVVNTFCEFLEKDGYFVGVYANQNWWQNYLKDVTKYTKWVARYSDQEPSVDNTDLWQFSSSILLNGIQTKVDASKIMRSDLIDTVKDFYSSKKSKKTFTDAKKTSAVAKKTYTVVKGDTLSAIAKSNRLTLKKLKELNTQIADPNKIYPGDVINLE